LRGKIDSTVENAVDRRERLKAQAEGSPPSHRPDWHAPHNPRHTWRHRRRPALLPRTPLPQHLRRRPQLPRPPRVPPHPEHGKSDDDGRKHLPHHRCISIIIFQIDRFSGLFEYIFLFRGSPARVPNLISTLAGLPQGSRIIFSCSRGSRERENNLQISLFSFLVQLVHQLDVRLREGMINGIEILVFCLDELQLVVGH